MYKLYTVITLEITLMKYGRYWPRIFGLNACSIFHNFFFRKIQRKVMTYGSPIQNMKTIHENLQLLDPNLCRWNKKKEKKTEKKTLTKA